MTYPNGTQIRVGDLIWWDEGLCVGYVQEIAESCEDYLMWGFSEPHLFVSNRHPFDASLGTKQTSMLVSYSANFLAEDGIGPLSIGERLELERAAELALAGRSYSCYSVTTHISDCTIKSWVFWLLDAQSRESTVSVSYEQPEAF